MKKLIYLFAILSAVIIIIIAYYLGRYESNKEHYKMQDKIKILENNLETIKISLDNEIKSNTIMINYIDSVTKVMEKK